MLLVKQALALLVIAAPLVARGGNSMQLTSTAFSPGGEIPTVHTCEGNDRAPALAWHGAPAGTKSFALIVDDPDAPDPKAPKMTWVHWVAYNIPSSTSALPEGGALPPGALDGLSDFKRTGFGGPCPPVGRHRYFHKIYALDVVLPDLKRPSKAALEKAMAGHVLAQAELIGTYQKKK
jgi:Raf kinase inhibitor-like YbhB/YbcL family protein